MQVAKFLRLFIFISIYTSKMNGQNWSLVWTDSFSNSNINTNNWNFESGTGNSGWGNNELQFYTNRQENATIQNGNLCIIAKKENYQGSNYTSARMLTKNLHQWTYGKIEARIKLPQTQGVWPAFWMLGSNIDAVNWPICGELDILEHINTENKIHGTMHWNNNGHVQSGSNTICNVSNFHTYGIEWNADSISWLLDNNVFYINSIKNNINNTQAFHKPFFIILNMAVGGNWPGSPNANSIFPDTMFVDYVNVFQKFATNISEVSNANTSTYPNPATDQIYINWSKNVLAETVTIYNATGSVTNIYKCNNADNFVSVNVSYLPKGFYFYVVKNKNNNLVSGKFIKE